AEENAPLSIDRGLRRVEIFRRVLIAERSRSESGDATGTDLDREDHAISKTIVKGTVPSPRREPRFFEDVPGQELPERDGQRVPARRRPANLESLRDRRLETTAREIRPRRRPRVGQESRAKEIPRERGRLVEALAARVDGLSLRQSRIDPRALGQHRERFG